MDVKKVFLDTNVVIDIIEPTRDNHKASIELLENLVLNSFEICISKDMLTTIYYISKDKSFTLNFFKNLIFVDWIILDFSFDVINKATSLALEKNLDLEDLLQCLCAKEYGCIALITNDKKFYNCGISVMDYDKILITL